MQKKIVYYKGASDWGSNHMGLVCYAVGRTKVQQHLSGVSQNYSSRLYIEHIPIFPGWLLLLFCLDPDD